jgi:hypothetical protein
MSDSKQSIADLKKAMQSKQSQPEPEPTAVQPEPTAVQPQRDRFIKGTLIDDKFIAIMQKVATILLILGVIGALWLFAEKQLSPRALAPYREWIPSIYTVVLMYITKPFLRLGWLGWGFVIVQSINLSGYLFQSIQGVVGVR